MKRNILLALTSMALLADAYQYDNGKWKKKHSKKDKDPDEAKVAEKLKEMEGKQSIKEKEKEDD